MSTLDHQGPMDENGDPVFEDVAQDNSKYVWYIGTNIPSTNLWVRRNGREYPIYSNTRGLSEWYTFDVDEYENTEVTELSDEFIEWLAYYHRYYNGLIESDSMFYADAIRDSQPDSDPKWYETELLNMVDNPSMTKEQEDLLEWAYNKLE